MYKGSLDPECDGHRRCMVPLYRLRDVTVFRDSLCNPNPSVVLWKIELRMEVL